MSTNTQGDMNAIEVPETPVGWVQRMMACALKGETIVIREGERGLGSATLERVRRQLEHAGGRLKRAGWLGGIRADDRRYTHDVLGKDH